VFDSQASTEEYWGEKRAVAFAVSAKEFGIFFGCDIKYHATFQNPRTTTSVRKAFNPEEEK
jgi:hypothetical protein